MTAEQKQKLIEKVQEYGKLPYDDEAELIGWLISAAVESLYQAGVPKKLIDDETDGGELYRLAVVRLTLHYYENREEVGASHMVPMGMDWMIEHLRLGYSDSDSYIT